MAAGTPLSGEAAYNPLARRAAGLAVEDDNSDGEEQLSAQERQARPDCHSSADRCPLAGRLTQVPTHVRRWRDCERTTSGSVTWTRCVGCGLVCPRVGPEAALRPPPRSSCRSWRGSSAVLLTCTRSGALAVAALEGLGPARCPVRRLADLPVSSAARAAVAREMDAIRTRLERDEALRGSGSSERAGCAVETAPCQTPLLTVSPGPLPDCAHPRPVQRHRAAAVPPGSSTRPPGPPLRRHRRLS